GNRLEVSSHLGSGLELTYGARTSIQDLTPRRIATLSALAARGPPPRAGPAVAGRRHGWLTPLAFRRLFLILVFGLVGFLLVLILLASLGGLVDTGFGEFGQLLVGGLFFLEGCRQQFSDIVVAQRLGPAHE